MSPQRPLSIHDHVFSTYITLRYGMAWLALLFPVLLYVVGKLVFGIGLQDSMSAYYFASAADDPHAYPMRTWFVGLLFAIGAALYLYKGFGRTENVLLNLAGSFAWLVAIYPMDRESGGRPGFHLDELSVHGTTAVLLFACLAWVAIFCAGRTLRELPAQHRDKEPRFRNAYRVIGAAMVTFPAIAFVLNVVVSDLSKYVFFAEAVGVWTFSAYWYTKSREMALSRMEERALMQELEAFEQPARPAALQARAG